MHYAVLPVLLSALGAVQAQKIELDKIASYPGPELVSAPVVVESDDPPDVAAPPVKPITTAAATSAKASRRMRRSPELIVKRDGDCSPEPTGSGPVPTPDTPGAFVSFSSLQTLATNVPSPDGYSASFTNKQGSLSASNYMGLTTLDSYDSLSCASLCDQADGCQAFNLYAERDPSQSPNADQCPNPSSLTNFKCTLWGSPVSASQATNTGQYRDSFQVVIAASNAYNKTAPPGAISGFTGPTELGGAIEAPLDAQGHDTYMGFQFFPFSQAQGYTPQTCADACSAQTAYNQQHPKADGSYQTCKFFDAYILSKNAVPQGLYCSLYNQTWARSYGTNYGQTSGSDRYTVSRSYSYSVINPPPDGTGTGTGSVSGSGSADACTSGPHVINGGFEDAGPTPLGWSVNARSAAATYKEASPGSSLAPADGSAANGGARCFSARVGPSALTQNSSLTLSQTVPTCAGKSYTLDFDYRFDGSTDNYCDLSQSFNVNYCGVGISSLNPSQPPGSWYTIRTFFDATKATTSLDFFVDCRSAAAHVQVDNVVLREHTGQVGCPA